MARRLSRDRKAATRSDKEYVLIVAEGECTEPNYFREFKCNTVNVEIVGTGYNTISLFNRAIKELNRLPKGSPVRDVYVVFDKDEFPAEDFHTAIMSCLNYRRRRGVTVHPIWSNPCFELWFLLHFEYRNTKIHRHDFDNLLSTALNVKYKKNLANIRNMILDKGGKEQDAIRHAQRLEEIHDEPGKYADHNPSTMVHQLVEKLIMLEKG